VTRASAISFKLFVAVFPALIVLLTVIPVLPIPDAQTSLLHAFHDLLPPDVYQFIEATLNDLIVRPHAALLSFSFIGAVYFASNSVDAILSGFKGSSNIVSWHSPVKQRLLSVLLLFVLSTLLLVAIPVLTASGWLINLLDERHILTSELQVVVLHLARWAISIGFLLLSIALLYHAGDPGHRRFRLVSPGSLVTSFLVILLSQALAFFFRHFTDYNALYGSIGAILAVQLWLYMNMIVVLIGHELNVSISRAHHDRSQRLRLVDVGGRAPRPSAARP
jgi:membrane protein